MGKHLSGPIDSVVRLHHPQNDENRRVDAPDRNFINAKLIQSRRPNLADEDRISELVTTERCGTTFWSSAIDYFVKGLAICGASLYPTALFPVEVYLAEIEARRQKIAPPRPRSVRSLASRLPRPEAAPEPGVNYSAFEFRTPVANDRPDDWRPPLAPDRSVKPQELAHIILAGCRRTLVPLALRAPDKKSH
jgi:hypothetical protein